jgi:nucleotide-binding universal stress UspA family protein
LHLVEKVVPPAQQLWYDAGGNLDRARKQVTEHYSELAEHTAKQLQQAGLSVETVVRDGNPRKAIVAAAKDWSADLIVMGAHHHSAIARLFLGNIALTVMDHSSCPVEIVPARPPTS